MVSKLQSHNKVVGAKQVKRALDSSDVEMVYIAKDAERKVVEKIEEISKSKGIDIQEVETMRVLGKACGIDINAAVAALLK